MSIEYCTQIRKALKDQTRTEIQWCAKAGVDTGCGGYSDGCPPKLQRYFISERGIPIERVTFTRKETGYKRVP